MSQDDDDDDGDGTIGQIWLRCNIYENSYDATTSWTSYKSTLEWCLLKFKII